MILTLNRDLFTETATIGVLEINGATFFTIEDTARALGVKIFGKTAIPEGEYTVRWTFSNRYQKQLPLIFNRDDFSVEDGRGVRFTGIRIHPGNTPSDTHGCILPGLIRGTNMVGRSRDAFDKIAQLMPPGQDYDLTIINSQA